jgi:hypothetical protein
MTLQKSLNEIVSRLQALEKKVSDLTDGKSKEDSSLPNALKTDTSIKRRIEDLEVQSKVTHAIATRLFDKSIKTKN